ncbi:hypothetical protein YQE_10152, partial [Dendroctonus ponderosae]
MNGAVSHIFKEFNRRLRKELSPVDVLWVHACSRPSGCAKVWRNTFGYFGEEWLFLAALGIFVAIISYSIDQGAAMCGKARAMLFSELADRYFAKWVAWVSIPVVLILWDVGITSLIAPKAVGSGVPQIKTCLRGIYLKEYLTFRVLIAKWMGIMATLGSGLPLGKEGPLIQMSSILVTKMGKYFSSFKSVYLNENKKLELIGAAYAVGVACTFNAPIGGCAGFHLLLPVNAERVQMKSSVEISTAYYAVRNYWRGFFAAVWGATVYRLLYVWIDGTDTIRVVFPTKFITDFPYDPLELISRFVYPFFVILIISTVTWPPGIGQFIASDLIPKDQVVQLFSDFTWTQANHTLEQQEVLKHWTTRWTGIYANLVLFIFYQVRNVLLTKPQNAILNFVRQLTRYATTEYEHTFIGCHTVLINIVFKFVASILAASMPIPCGTFIPNFRSGAALGRIGGELMATWFPQGVRYKGKITKILPGAYATVGAVAWSGAVTHTLSTSVIMFEMTSQISHVIPVLISNLIANGIARFFTPSVYDLAIQAGNLPFLPDLLPSSSAIYQIYVEDFMVHDVKFVYLGMTYEELKNILKSNKQIRVFPLVDNARNMILLGSVARNELIELIERQIGFGRRMEVIKHKDDTNNEKNIADELLEEKLPELRVIRICDLPKEEQDAWEQNQLSEEIDLGSSQIDPAPFQLVEKTSLLKVHSLFSMMHLNTAYVTAIGKLIGVVGVKELRKAIEDANNGQLPVVENGITEGKKEETFALLKK